MNHEDQDISPVKPHEKGSDVSSTGIPPVPTEHLEPSKISLKDGLLALIGFFILWLGVSVVVYLVRDYFSPAGLAYLGGFLTQVSIAALAFGLIAARKLSLASVGYRNIPKRSMLLSVVGAYFVVMLLNVMYAGYIASRGLEPPATDAYELIFSQRDAISILLTTILAVVLAPLLEETVFRGIIYSSLRSKWGPWVAAVLSAAIFSAIHLQLLGFVPRFFLGLALAYLFEKYQSLYPGMTLHALNNGIAILVTLAVKLPS